MSFDTTNLTSDSVTEDGCAQLGVETDKLLHYLDEASQHESLVGELRGFRLAPLNQIVNYIVEKHHVFTRQELVCLDALLDKVCAVHGARHTELLRIRSLVESLSEELTVHMRREERVLFPYIKRMEEALKRNEIFPRPVFGTTSVLVRLMSSEHERAVRVLGEIRRASSDYTVPPDGCDSYRLLYRTLKNFDLDLRQHIYLEDCVLFPRAVKMESLCYPYALRKTPQSRA